MACHKLGKPKFVPPAFRIRDQASSKIRHQNPTKTRSPKTDPGEIRDPTKSGRSIGMIPMAGKLENPHGKSPWFQGEHHENPMDFLTETDDFPEIIKIPWKIIKIHQNPMDNSHDFSEI